MKVTGRDRVILLVLAGVGLVAAFWFLVLAPKRDRASELEAQLEQVRGEIQAQEQVVSQAAAARDNYEGSYRSLVELGKAVPNDSDTSSLLVQLQGLADRAKVEFGSIKLTEDSGSAADAGNSEGEPKENAEQVDGSDTGDGSVEGGAEDAPPTMAPATEASAATLPLGATVGPAGLPVMSYEVTLAGNFFGIADFMASLDRLVRHRGGKLVVDGRLFTVNGFTMEAPPEPGGGNRLDVTLSLSAFLVPGESSAAPAAGGADATTTPSAASTP